MIREWMAGYPAPLLAVGALVVFFTLFTIGLVRIIRDRDAQTHAKLPLE